MFVAALLGLTVLGPLASPAAGKGASPKIETGPTSDQLTDADAKKLKEAKLKKSDPLNTSSVTAAAAAPVDPITQRVLVIATTGDPNPDGVNVVPPSTSWDWSLSTLTNSLDYVGMPYDTYKSSSRQLCQNGTWKIVYSVNPTDSTCTGTVQDWGSVTRDRLWDGAITAYYSAVMLVSGNLVYTTNATDPVPTFPTGMTPEEWSVLWTFEAAFGIRTVSAFTHPTADYGMTYLGEGPSADPTTATYTAAGKSAFPYVAATLPISNSWIYQAAVDPAQSATTTPILTDGAGNVLGVIKTYPEQANRQTLALTFNSARYLTHGLVLGYGLVNWVTKGQFLGFRKAMIDVQPDDIFIEDDVWQYNAANGGTIPQYPDCPDPEDPRMDVYRMTGADLMATINWQAAKQAQPTSKAFKITWPFVGEGTVAGYWPNDTLTSTAKANQGKFKWVNHTWDHTNLDAVSYSVATSLINRNNTLANQMKFKTYNKQNLVQPDISGIGNYLPTATPTVRNEEFLRAAFAAGVRNLITDTSRAPWFNPGPNGPNEGTWLTGDGYSLFGVARYPVSLYFNISTPEQWLAEDNCLYPPGAPFGHVSTYDQLLDRESNNLLRYLLQGDNRPLMFHQPNLRAYPGGNGRSVLSDLIDATLTKYNQLVTVPILSPTMDEEAALQKDRMAYNDAWKNGNLTASVVPNTSITLSSTKNVVVPLTGFRVTTSGLKTETYAGQRITYVPLTAGVPRTLGIR